MSKQKRPDTYREEIQEVPRHKGKRKKKPRAKKPAPKKFSCPFCEYVFSIKETRLSSWFSLNHPRNFKCNQCGASPWGYMREEDTVLPKWLYGRRMASTREVWIPEYCSFCNTGANLHTSKEHYFMLWTSPEDDVYCDRCGFRGKIGGKRK